MDAHGGSVRHVKRGGAIALALAALMAMPAGASADQIGGDFNGDGRGDLAVGLEGQSVSGQARAGAVQVIYGSKRGLTGNGDRVFTQDTRGMKERAEPSDGFGVALATGDFNGDRFADLAVGVPFEDRAGKQNAGAVQILYGSRHGLRTSGDQLFVVGEGGVQGQPDAFGGFGWSLAAANFGRSRFADLAVGTIGADVGGADGAGALNVLYGSRSGLRGKGSQRFSQDTPGVAAISEADDQFAASLAAADFGRDGHADLAVGVRDEDVGTAGDAGAVNVLYGSPKGLGPKHGQFLDQDQVGFGEESAEADERFGSSLAAANLGRGDRADLAIGVPGQTVGMQGAAGEVNIVYGSRAGLQSAGVQVWSQANVGSFDAPGANERFGDSLAAANFGRSKQSDLAVGAPNDCPGSALCTVDAGAVDVLYGSASGLSSANAQYFSQGQNGVADQEETGDLFGFGVAAGRFEGARISDLAISAPTEDLRVPDDDAGAVHVLRGSPSGITTDGDRFLTQGHAGLQGSIQKGDEFGAALSGPYSGTVFD